MFAANLRAVREQRGISQEYVADRMTKAGYKWHQATVYKVESGAREVKLGEAQALSGILGVSVAALMSPGNESVHAAEISAAYNELANRRMTLWSDIHAWREAGARLQEAINAAGEGFLNRHFDTDRAREIIDKLRERVDQVEDGPPW